MPLPGSVTIVEVGPRDGLQNEAARDPDRRQARLHRPARRGRPVRDRGDVVRPPARGPAARRRGRPVPVDRPRARRPVPGPRARPCGASSARSPPAPTRSRSSSAPPTRSTGPTSTARPRRRSADAARSSAMRPGPVDARPRLRVGGVRLPVRGDGGPGDDRRRGGPAARPRLRRDQPRATRSGRRRPATSPASSTSCCPPSTSERVGLHAHDTRGQALANVYAALERGVTVDRQLGGRPRRLPVRRSGGGRQPRDRGPRLPARRPAASSTGSASRASWRPRRSSSRRSGHAAAQPHLAGGRAAGDPAAAGNRR